MRLVKQVSRLLAGAAAFLVLSWATAGVASASRRALVGDSPPAGNHALAASSATGQVLIVDPASFPCGQVATFDELPIDSTTGINYDSVLYSGGIFFAKCFAGQSVGFSGNFDVVTGTPSSPLTLQAGPPGSNLDVFTLTTNVLTGLGHLGFPDMDAIGEGSIAIAFTSGQAQVSLQVVGGNGGPVTLGFYGQKGALVDTIVLSGIGDITYGFVTANGHQDLYGILIQNTDASGIGVDNVCLNTGSVNARATTWGTLKALYR